MQDEQGQIPHNNLSLDWYLLGPWHNVKVKQILSYELAPVPTIMFEGKTRDVRIAKAKSTLNNKLQVAQ